MTVKTMVGQLSRRYELTPLRWGAGAGLFVCAALLSWRLKLGDSVGTLALFALLFWLARQEWRTPSSFHARAWGAVYALGLGAALTVGRLVQGGQDARGDLEVNYIAWEGAKDLLVYLPLAVVLWLAFLQLRRVCAAHSLKDMAPRSGGSRCFLAAWGFIFLCWTPYLLAFWPAGLVGDGAHALESALKTGFPGGTHWGVLFILSLKLFIWLAGAFGGGLSVALCLYAVAQSLAFSAVCAAVIRQLYVLGAPRVLAAAVAAMYGLSGFFATYGMVLWKDTLFSAAVVLLCLQLWDFAARGGRGRAVPFFFTVLFLCFWRSNGIYVAVPTLVVLALVVRKKAGRLVAAGVAALVLVALVQGPVYDVLQVKKDSMAESLSIPLQQLAATISRDRPLTDAQSEVLFTLMPEDVWKDRYCPCLSDDLKSNPQLDTDYLETHFSDFLRVWAELLPANLDVYVEAYLMQTLGFWAPGRWAGWYYEYFHGIVDLFGHGITGVDWFARLTGHGMQDVLASFTRFVTSGTMVWFMLGSFFFCLAKPRGRRKADLLMLTPLLFSWLCLMLAVPIAHSYRYILMLPVGLPLLGLVLVYDRPAGDENT